jgi:hypothetical protein
LTEHNENKSTQPENPTPSHLAAQRLSFFAQQRKRNRGSNGKKTWHPSPVDNRGIIWDRRQIHGLFRKQTAIGMFLAEFQSSPAPASDPSDDKATVIGLRGSGHGPLFPGPSASRRRFKWEKEIGEQFARTARVFRLIRWTVRVSRKVEEGCGEEAKNRMLAQLVEGACPELAEGPALSFSKGPYGVFASAPHCICIVPSTALRPAPKTKKRRATPSSTKASPQTRHESLIRTFRHHGVSISGSRVVISKSHMWSNMS